MSDGNTPMMRRAQSKPSSTKGQGLDERLLKMLVCPETHRALSLLNGAALQAVNRRILQGQAKNRQGDVVQTVLDAGLIAKGTHWVYPVREGIPVMLMEEAIALP